MEVQPCISYHLRCCDPTIVKWTVILVCIGTWPAVSLLCSIYRQDSLGLVLDTSTIDTSAVFITFTHQAYPHFHISAQIAHLGGAVRPPRGSPLRGCQSPGTPTGTGAAGDCEIWHRSCQTLHTRPTWSHLSHWQRDTCPRQLMCRGNRGGGPFLQETLIGYLQVAVGCYDNGELGNRDVVFGLITRCVITGPA